MKLAVTLVLLLAALSLLAVELEPPEIHTAIMVDAKFYSGDAANNGTYDTTNRFQVRKAAVGLEGRLLDRMHYAFEAGIATCVGSGTTLQLMDASLMYEVTPDIKLGLQKGHVLRGFSAKTECIARLGMEKPVFATTFGVCHPLGAVANGYFHLGEAMGLEVELAAMNGSTDNVYRESEYLVGAIFETPLEGLSLGGSYSMNTRNSYYDTLYVQYNDTGYRAVAGVEYQDYGFWATAEYYTGEGFERDDQVMNAWYAQLGYEIKLDCERLRAIQPYGKIESWDKDADADDGADHLYRFVEAGVNFKLSAWSMLRCAYRAPMEIPDADVVDSSDYSSFIVRLQTGF